MSVIFPEDAWAIEAPLAPADMQTLREKLGAYNIARSTIDQGDHFGIILRDDQDEIVAGTYGWLWGDCLEILFLWIDERYRGQGFGRRLVTKMEQAGLARGARLAMLETYSFQAPGFYEGLGYETFGLIDGYGRQHAKHFMRKTLL